MKLSEFTPGDGIEPRVTVQSHYLGGGGTIEAIFQASAIEGECYHSDRFGTVSETPWAVVAKSPLVSGEPIASSYGGCYHTALWALPGGGFAKIMHDPSDGEWSVDVARPTATGTRAWLARMAKLLPPLQMVGGGVPMSYWYLDKTWGPQSMRTRVTVGSWAEIQPNYPKSCNAALGRLASLDGHPDGGRAIMLHGTPGSGKSRFLSALARDWAPWADFHVVMDPDEYLADKSYLYGMLNRAADTDRTTVVVLEDCDRFVDQRTQNHSEPGVAALLNITDGLMGVLARLLVILTTNVEFDKLDAALLRPGRCLANVHVDRFSRTEAEAWLASRDVTLDEAVGRLAERDVAVDPEAGLTLAELYGGCAS